MTLDLLQPYTHKLAERDIKPTSRVILVSIAEQQLYLFENTEIIKSFSVSTGIKPPSNTKDSGGTPKGLHRIARKIGDGAPLGEVFKGRKSIGKRYWELSEEQQAPNLVATRILWLEGLEPGYNQGKGCDSFERYIYIHGTNHEDKIGQPASGGCIVLSNKEAIELFDAADEGDLVWIQ